MNPFDPSQYLLGILLDGDTYKQTKNTRDREIGQKSLLEGRFGWELYRIWAIDWWEDQEDVLDHLLEKLGSMRSLAEQESAQHSAPDQVKELSAEDDKALEAELTQQADEIEAEMDDADYEPELIEENTAQTQQADSKPLEIEEPVPLTEPVAGVIREELETQDKQDEDAGPVQDIETPANTSETEYPLEEPVSEHELPPVPEPESVPEPVSDNITLMDLLQQAGVEIIDKRDLGGLLWIIGGQELQPLVRRCQEIGVKFTFKEGGGKVCKGRDAWWTDFKDPVLQSESVGQEVSLTSDFPETQNGSFQESDSAIDHNLPEKEIIFEKMTTADDAADPVVFTSGTEPSEEPYKGTLYIPTVCPDTAIGWMEYCKPSNKDEIMRRAILIVEGEKVIERDLLLEKVRSSFGVKNSEKVAEATEKAVKAAKIKTTKVKGIQYCWASDIDPKVFTGFRYHEETKRSPDELPLPEMRNAVVRTLLDNGPLNEDDLLVRTARTFGYQRLGPNLKIRLAEGIAYAVSDKKIRLNKQKKYELREE